MSADPRTLAADLRGHGAHWLFAREAAADLIELVVAPLHDAWLQANPPCPTCGGFEQRALIEGVEMGVQCPDCPDCPNGVLPFDKWTAGLVALWTRVHDETMRHDYLSADLPDALALLDVLRQIGGTR